MSETELNRDDPEQAEKIIRELCPSLANQRLILSQLLLSISVADKLAPHSWAVTLFTYGFRLNIGMVEVYFFRQGNVHLFLFGQLPPEATKVGEIHTCEFLSMPQPQHYFSGSITEFEKASPNLQAAHAAFVRAAALTKNGNARKANYARYHSAGLHTYAKRIVGETSAGAEPLLRLDDVDNAPPPVKRAARLPNQREGTAGNTAKHLSYAEAWRRIDQAIAKHFYFEAVTLQEGIIADRLLSFVKGREPGSRINVRSNFGELIKHWRRLAPDLPVDSTGKSLASRVDDWRGRRNEVVHGLVKSEPGQPTEAVGAFIERCRETALDGQALGREIQRWHQRSLRGVRVKVRKLTRK